MTAGSVLGTWEANFHFDKHEQYLADVRDSLSIGLRAAVYLRVGAAHRELVLADNVRLGPWIRVGSTVRNLGLITDGACVATRGSVRAEYEKRTILSVDLDLVVTADERPVADRPHRHLPPATGGRGRLTARRPTRMFSCTAPSVRVAVKNRHGGGFAMAGWRLVLAAAILLRQDRTALGLAASIPCGEDALVAAIRRRFGPSRRAGSL
ncbi:MAG: hypothetical protein R2749_12860 [Acidimicrobiales bacterium]